MTPSNQPDSQPNPTPLYQTHQPRTQPQTQPSFPTGTGASGPVPNSLGQGKRKEGRRPAQNDAVDMLPGPSGWGQRAVRRRTTLSKPTRWVGMGGGLATAPPPPRPFLLTGGGWGVSLPRPKGYSVVTQGWVGGALNPPANEKWRQTPSPITSQSLEGIQWFRLHR